MAWITSGVPLNGTWVTLMSAAATNFSVLRCVPLPIPAWPQLIAPGFDFASFTRSMRVLYAEPAFTTSTFGWLASGTTSVKSLSVS